MISWLIGIKQGFHFSLGKNYKFMKQYAPEAVSYTHLDVYKRQVIDSDIADAFAGKVDFRVLAGQNVVSA